MQGMIKTILFIFLLFSGVFTSWSQTVIDTVFTERGAMVIYSNRTWEYLDDKHFDGILNAYIHAACSEDPDHNFVQTWDNDVCYTSGRQNDLSKLKDTLWVCLMDEEHPGFHPPVPGIVTSRYGFRSGRYHNGIDINLNTGDTVRSAWDGKIRYAKWNDGGFGNLIIIRHYNGLETFYAHLSKLLVVPDQDVKAGEVIGLGGNTGRSFGAHLHFEVRFYDAPMNPEEVIDFDKHVCKDENLMVHKGLFRPGAKPSDQIEHGENEMVARVDSGSRVYYKVRSGDTLSSIASRNRTTVSKLCQLNGIKPTSVLQVGRSLRVR
jgi:hypothetical protein